MRVYREEILGVVYTYRGATRGELRNATSMKVDVDAEDYLCRNCVISPTIDFENGLAGIPTRLSKLILDKSGVSKKSEDEFNEEAMDWLSTPAGKLESITMAVFNMSYSEVAALDPPDWYKTTLAAQVMAGILFGMDTGKFMKEELFKHRPKTLKEEAINKAKKGRVQDATLGDEMPPEMQSWMAEQKRLAGLT